MNGKKTVTVDEKYEKAFDGLRALLAMIGPTSTGDAVLRLKLNQGGIQGLRVSIEVDPLAR